MRRDVETCERNGSDDEGEGGGGGEGIRALSAKWNSTPTDVRTKAAGLPNDDRDNDKRLIDIAIRPNDYQVMRIDDVHDDAYFSGMHNRT